VDIMSYTPQQIKTIEGTLTNFLNWSNINYPVNGSKYRIYQTVVGLGRFLDASVGWSQAGVWILSIAGAQNFLGASYINGGASTPPVTPSAPLSIASSDSIMAWIRGLPVRRI